MRVVANKLRRILIGLGIKEAIETIESAPERPAVERPGGAAFDERGHVPFADHVIAIGMCAQHLRQSPGLARSCRDSRDSRSRNWQGTRRRRNEDCAR